ncbi:MAG: isoamylase early set domain-containing protein [Candidatus Cloacimonetes bacterium]|nr:isoamylase early set domain-containing protein [Candidatus Cloacimonadota bacterium]
MCLKKQFLKSKVKCKVTFKITKDESLDAEKVAIVGEFNQWSLQVEPMKKLKNGDFTQTLELDSGKEYQFRYFIDDERWENDFGADRYVYSPFANCDNSVVSCIEEDI